MSQRIHDVLTGWNSIKSAELYGVDAWGNGYFHITSDGYTAVRLKKEDGSPLSVKLYDIAHGLYERGMRLPILLRFGDLLAARIKLINESFAKAIRDYNYQGVYRGVYPIKVNQQQQAVSDVVKHGAPWHHGLEAASKAELVAALAHLSDRQAYLICNGYKDAEFIDLALYSVKMGLQTILVLETPSELQLILERAEQLGIQPRIGIRVKLSSRVGGKWSESGGDRAVFGLTPAQIIDVVDLLRDRGMLDRLELLHYHLGSQIPNIREIRDAVKEAAHVYAALVKEGAKMGILDIGGGLAIDYDGSRSNFASSANYDIPEYAADVIEGIMHACDSAGIAHPTVISESGRALIAYYSVLLVNVIDAAYFDTPSLPRKLSDDPAALPEHVQNLLEVAKSVTVKKLAECFNDALYYREELQKAFRQGHLSLRHHAFGESLFWHILTRIKAELPKVKLIPDDLNGLEEIMADIYYCNFSVFQSLPDAWAIDQLFPVMPIHKLAEKPDRRAYLSDITCDCDGKIDNFIDLHDVKKVLPVHAYQRGDEYIFGIFMIGAYQETLGDLHNLFGDTNVVSVNVDAEGEIHYSEELDGDSVGDVLSYVEYSPANLQERFRQLAEEAVRMKRITPIERRQILSAFDAGLRGYTYFEE